MPDEVPPAGGSPAPASAAAPSFAVRAVTGTPSSIDRETRTVEVIWSTGARARNWVRGVGEITEELDLSPNAVRMAVLQGGAAPVLDTHQSYGARSVLGRVVAARLEGGRGIATLRFSEAEDVQPIWQRIADGSLRSVSVGYRIYRYEQIIDPVTQATVHRAVDWEPYEISVVPVPVDPAAAVRGELGFIPPAAPPAIEGHRRMPDTPPPAGTTANAPQAPAPTEAQRGTDPAQPPASRPAAPEDPVAAAQRAERERVSALGPVVQAARGLVEATTVDQLHNRAVAEGWTADALRGALWDAMVRGARPASIPATPTSGNGSDDPAQIRDAMADAIAVRAMPGFQARNARHVEFLGWRPSDMMGEMLRARGERNVPRLPAALAERAFHTTSDFPLLLSAAANKMLLAAYQPAQPTYRQIFFRRDFRDFKAHRHLRVGDFPNLLQLNESGEIQAGTISESQELVYLQTYARRIRVTRQMLVNDDLGAFTDFSAMIGRRVADFENATAYALLNTANGDGPTLATGSAAVFGTAAARANKASSGTALDLPNLAAGRAAVMKQKTLDGLPISVGAQMRLLVGPNQELAARQLTVNVAAAEVGKANVYAGFVQPVVEPQIPSNRWYLFADPASAPVYVYGYLNGAEGPQVTTGAVSGVDGVEISVVFDFGVGAVDYRGGYFNAGT